MELNSEQYNQAYEYARKAEELAVTVAGVADTASTVLVEVAGRVGDLLGQWAKNVRDLADQAVVKKSEPNSWSSYTDSVGNHRLSDEEIERLRKITRNIYDAFRNQQRDNDESSE